VTLLPRQRQEPPTPAQRRTADNVRPHGACNPARCPVMRTPPVHAHGHRCITCGFNRSTQQTHCHLYETCDRCTSDVDPCDTALQVAEEATVQPVVWGPR